MSAGTKTKKFKETSFSANDSNSIQTVSTAENFKTAEQREHIGAFQIMDLRLQNGSEMDESAAATDSTPMRQNEQMNMKRDARVKISLTDSQLLNEDDDDAIPGMVYKSTTLEQRNSNQFHPRTLSEIKQNSNNFFQFARNVKTYISDLGSTTCWLIVYGILLIAPLLMIIFGSIYMEKCDGQKNIPIFLLVNGIFLFFKLLVSVYKKIIMFRLSEGKDSEQLAPSSSRLFNWINYALEFFLFIWFICGCAWVYGSYEWIKFDEEATKFGTGEGTEFERESAYCHPIVFNFAFWILTLQLIGAVVAIFAVVLFGAIVYIMAK